MNTNSTIIVWSCVILSNIHLVSNTGIRGMIYSLLWLSFAIIVYIISIKK
jgi:hypothetical protein